MPIEKLILIFALSGSAFLAVKGILEMLARIKGKPAQAANTGQTVNADLQAFAAELASVRKEIAAARAEIAARVAIMASQEMAKETAVEPAASNVDADPIEALRKECEDKATACLIASKRAALAAVEATGKEKARLLAEARMLAEKADEYRQIFAAEVVAHNAIAKARTEAVAKAKENAHLSRNRGKKVANFEVIE